MRIEMLHSEKRYFSRIGVGHISIDWHCKKIRKVGNTVFFRKANEQKINGHFFFDLINHEI